MYVCLCNSVSDRQVRALAATPGSTMSTIHRTLGIAPKCGKCLPMMRDIVREAGGAGCEASI